MDTVFFSYSRHDRGMLEQLKNHLVVLKDEGLIETWFDQNILPGEDWDTEVKQALEKSNIILLLVSSDFLATDYIREVEIKEAMKRHRCKKARVIPVILRPCDWEASSFGRLNALPPKGRPVNTYSNRDEAWLEVVRGVKAVLNNGPVPQNEETATVEVGKSDFDQYNYKSIYKLLDTAFNDEQLTTFCLLHFEKVYNNFTAGQSKGQRVLALVDYSKRHLEVEKLLSLLREENSAQYEQFKPYK